MMPLALACADAGHEAVIATGPPFLGRLPLPTVPGYPPQLELDWAIQETRRRHPDLHDQDFSMAMFADVTAEFAAPTMIEQCERFRPDLVVYEAMFTGTGVAASTLGVPALAYAIALATFVYRPLHASTVGYQRDTWLQRDRTPPDGDGLLAAALINPRATNTPAAERRHCNHCNPTGGLQRGDRRSAAMAGRDAYPSAGLSKPQLLLPKEPTKSSTPRS
jgi:hypothetical protein